MEVKQNYGLFITCCGQFVCDPDFDISLTLAATIPSVLDLHSVNLSLGTKNEG